MATPTLYGLHYSPWTIRARWALKHHGLPFRYREHVAYLGEPLLRRRAKRAGLTSASVPLYVKGRHAFGDSWAIIEHADALGEGPSLRAKEEAVRAWSERIEPALQEARRRVTRRILNDPEALAEAAAAGTLPGLGWLFRPVAARGARFLADKYGMKLDAPDREGPMEEVLDALRERVGEHAYLEGDAFSAADIAAAVFLQAVRPVEGHIRLAPATRRAWTDEALAARYPEVLAWRDGIFARHFPKRGR